MASSGNNYRGGPPAGNQNARGPHRPGAGRKSRYRPEYAERAIPLAMLGCTDEEIGKCFDVNESVIRYWQTRYVEFAAALKKGRMGNTSRVVAALYKRAVGFRYKRITGYKKVIEQDEKGGSIEKEIPITEKVYMPPDPTSIIFFLTNRLPQHWKRNDQGRESQFQAERKGKLHELWNALRPDAEEPLPAPEERKPS